MPATTAKSDWITKQRTVANGLILACEAILAIDQEYLANGYSASLTDEDFVGENGGITAAESTTAEGNLVKIAQAVLGIGTFPASIEAGTNTTIFAIK